MTVQGSIILQGTVSHGTLRTQDLLRSFADELERVDPNAGSLPDAARVAADTIDRSDENTATINETHLLDVLFDRLDEIASEHGLYFGAHPGDGADFGYWEPEQD